MHYAKRVDALCKRKENIINKKYPVGDSQYPGL
jgi:hypothetical protein